jgi:Protein of unknown function, DUF547
MKIFIAFLMLILPLHAYEAPYDGLLKAHVKSSERSGITGAFVNYSAWKSDNRHEAALKSLLQQTPSKMTLNEQLAFWINAYNLLTVDVIIKTGETKSIRNQGTFILPVWKKFTWKIEEKSISLDDIEHKILRKMGEPRIHFAIVCASLSCPDLKNGVYKANVLDLQLAEQTKAFLGNSTKGISSEGKISQLFDWFKADFGNEKGVKAFIGGGEVKGFLSYDWSLNSL